jgi:hypothetical protein
MTRIPSDSNSVPSFEAPAASNDASFEAKFNRAVVWTASHTSRQIEKLALDSSDSSLAKVGKVFAALLASIVLVPCALIAAFSCAVSDFLFGTIRETPQEVVSQKHISSCCTRCKSL